MGSGRLPSLRGRKEKGGWAVPGGGGRALWELLKMQRSFEMAFRLWRRVHAGVYIRGIYHRRRTLCRGWPGFCRKHYPDGPVWGITEGRQGPGVVLVRASSPVIRLRSHIVLPDANHPTDEKKE